MSTLMVFILVVGFIAGGLLLLRDTANKPMQRPPQKDHTSNNTPADTSNQDGSDSGKEVSKSRRGDSRDDGAGSD